VAPLKQMALISLGSFIWETKDFTNPVNSKKYCSGSISASQVDGLIMVVSALSLAIIFPSLLQSTALIELVPKSIPIRYFFGTATKF
jgi:hypothetical protein